MLCRDNYLVVSSFLGSFNTVKSLDRVCRSSHGLVPERMFINTILSNNNIADVMLHACTFGIIDLYYHIAARGEFATPQQMFMMACKYNQFAIIDALLTEHRMGDVVNKAFIEAARRGHFVLMNKLIEKVHPSKLKKTIDKAVIAACESGKHEVIKMYMKNACDMSGILVTCAENTNYHIAKMIIDSMQDDAYQLFEYIDWVCAVQDDQFCLAMDMLKDSTINQWYDDIVDDVVDSKNKNTVLNLQYLHRRTGNSIGTHLETNLTRDDDVDVFKTVLSMSTAGTYDLYECFKEACKKESTNIMTFIYIRLDKDPRLYETASKLAAEEESYYLTKWLMNMKNGDFEDIQRKSRMYSEDDEDNTDEDDEDNDEDY